MLSIAICDDEELIRKHVRKCLTEYSMKRGIDVSCVEYGNGEALIRGKARHDIIMLDYNFDHVGERDGITIAKIMRANGNDTPIIFITSHPKVVFTSFEVSAFRFLVKPLESAKLFKALDDYAKSIEVDTTLAISQSRETFILNTKQIVFVEGDGKYCRIHMTVKPEEMECHETLAQVEARLPAVHFNRCHRSIVVNMRFVSSYTHDGITLKNKKWVPISRAKYSSFHDAFIEYSSKYGY